MVAVVMVVIVKAVVVMVVIVKAVVVMVVPLTLLSLVLFMSFLHIVFSVFLLGVLLLLMQHSHSLP